MDHAIRELSLADYPVIGTGFSSTVYDLGDGTVAKIAREGMPQERVVLEYELTRLAADAGVPCVKAYELVRVGTRLGIVFEKLPGHSLGDAIRSNPDQMGAWVEKYVALAKKLHSIRVTSDLVPDIKGTWLGHVDGLSAWCSERERELIRSLVSAMPETGGLIHGDLHPGNIMVRDGELVLIDMPLLSRGTHLCDLAITYRCLVLGPTSPDIKQRERSMGMPAEMIAEVGRLFFKGYADVQSDEALERLFGQIDPLCALSIVVMCGNGRMRDDGLARSIMDQHLRKVVIPHEDTIREIFSRDSFT